MEQIIKSESIANIASALHGFHKNFKVVKKNDSVSVSTKTGGSYNFSYATLDNILEVIHEDLSAAGLTMSQHPIGEGYLNTLLMHVSGEWMESSFKLKQDEAGIKAQGSAITYGRRYAACAILNISIDDDDDAGKASGDKTVRKGNNGQQQQPRQQGTQQGGPPEPEKPWLNALTKDGELTDVGKKVVEALQNGTRTLAQIEAKNRLNKQEKEYLSKIKRIEQPAGDVKQPVNNKTPWAQVSDAKKNDLLKSGEAFIRSAYMLTDEESTKLSNYYKSLKQTA